MKHYTINEKTTDCLPDPCMGCSPMTEALFVQLGGTITDDGEPSPKEKFIADLTEYLDSVEEECKKLGIPLTVADFYAAASTMFSTDLVEWASEQGVPPDMIEDVRQQMLVFIADASRLGLTWGDIFKINAK